MKIFAATTRRLSRKSMTSPSSTQNLWVETILLLASCAYKIIGNHFIWSTIFQLVIPQTMGGHIACVLLVASQKLHEVKFQSCSKSTDVLSKGDCPNWLRHTHHAEIFLATKKFLYSRQLPAGLSVYQSCQNSVSGRGSRRFTDERLRAMPQGGTLDCYQVRLYRLAYRSHHIQGKAVHGTYSYIHANAEKSRYINKTMTNLHMKYIWIHMTSCFSISTALISRSATEWSARSPDPCSQIQGWQGSVDPLVA